MALEYELRFEERRFKFADGEQAPEHFDGSPLGCRRNAGKYALIRELIGPGQAEIVAINIDDPETAELLASACLRHARGYEDSDKRRFPNVQYRNEYAVHILTPVNDEALDEPIITGPPLTTRSLPAD